MLSGPIPGLLPCRVQVMDDKRCPSGACRFFAGGVLYYGTGPLMGPEGNVVSKTSKLDADHFRAAMKDVRAIKDDERHHEPRPVALPLRPRRADPPDIPPAAPGGHLAAAVADACKENRPLARKDVSPKALRALGQRQNPVADSFDLHGMNEKQARAALERFLAESLRDGLSCVRVVHGKGLRSPGPAVLRLMSWQLLWRHPEVLALKPCAPRDGGSGAVLVMLARTLEDPA